MAKVGSMKKFRLDRFLLSAMLLAGAANTIASGMRLMPQEAAQAATELSELLRDNYVFPDIAVQYAEALESRTKAEFYSGEVDLIDFAVELDTLVNEVHQDAHLSVIANAAEREGERRMRRVPGNRGAVGTTTWIDDDIAYVELLGLPGDEASQEAMAKFLDEYRGARALIIDARMCPGGTLPVIDVLSSRLYEQPTHLVTMDMRIDASGELLDDFNELPSLHRAESAATIARFEHWAAPSNNPADRVWADVPVYYLTNMTASACEHLALSLKATDRAKLVGNTTRGAGHFGGMEPFANGALKVFLPVGRTFDPATGKDWEGDGIEPDIKVPSDQALRAALSDIGVDPGLAASVSPQGRGTTGSVIRRVNPEQKSYGLGIMPPRPGESAIEVMMVTTDSVAAAAGLRQGDRIVAINGTRVADMEQSAVIAALRSSELGLEVSRAGETFDVQLALD
jgi:C-terminal processing protease CtpA/Prc